MSTYPKLKLTPEQSEGFRDALLSAFYTGTAKTSLHFSLHP